jgi:hypothetical protein
MPDGPLGPGKVLAAPVGPAGPLGPGTVLGAPVAPRGPISPDLAKDTTRSSSSTKGNEELEETVLASSVYTAPSLSTSVICARTKVDISLLRETRTYPLTGLVLAPMVVRKGSTVSPLTTTWLTKETSSGALTVTVRFSPGSSVAKKCLVPGTTKR